jgi:DNA-binding beta-propeller fold protein YncE
MPWGVTVDEFDDVYVADWRNDRIQKFTADGEFVFKFGSSGSADGEFNRPAGVAVDGDGDVYVADSGNDRVQLFNQEGRFVQKFVGDATLSKSARAYMLSNPMFLRLRDMASIDVQKFFRRPRSVRVDEKGQMLVPDYGSFRVQIYKKDVERLREDQIAAPLSAPSLLTA